MIAFLAAVIALVPLLILPHSLFYFDVTPKVVLFLSGAAAALPFLRPRALTAGRESRWLLILLVAGAASLVLSTAFSSRVDLSVAGTAWRRFGFVTQMALLLFLAVMVSRTAGYPARVRTILRAVAAAGIPIALYGILQYFNWDPWLPKEGYHIGEGYWTIVRPPSTLGYVSYFANYLLYPVFSGLALYLVEEERGWRVLGLLAATLATVAIVFSGTRAAMLALGVGLLLLGIWLRPRITRRAAWFAAGICLTAAAFYYSPAGQPLRSRSRWFVEDPKGGPRLRLWRDSIRMGFDHWALGTGPETFSTEFPQFQSPELARQFPDFYHESSHNLFLDAFTAQGIPGLAVLLAFCALGYWAAWRARPADPKLSGALAAALTAALVTQQFTVLILPTALLLLLTVALSVALITPPAQEIPERPRLALIPVSVLLLVAALRLAVADRSLFTARLELEAGHLPVARLASERAATWGISADLWYSRGMALAARRAPDPATALWATQQALQAAVRATKTAEDPQNAWYHLASLYALRNDPAHTVEALRATIAASPNWFKPHWMLAQVLLLTGRREEARKEAAIAADLDAGKNPEVSRTLAQIIQQ